MIKRQPTHPGEILKYDYLEPLKLSITQLAKVLGVSRKAMSAIVNERKSVTPEMALRLAQAFSTTPELWLNLQKNYDLWQVAQITSDWQGIEPIYNPDDDLLDVAVPT
jgi:addiction module HigA family antidote